MTPKMTNSHLTSALENKLMISFWLFQVDKTIDKTVTIKTKEMFRMYLTTLFFDFFFPLFLSCSYCSTCFSNSWELAI